MNLDLNIGTLKLVLTVLSGQVARKKWLLVLKLMGLKVEGLKVYSGIRAESPYNIICLKLATGMAHAI